MGPKDDGLKATADIIRQNLDASVETYVNVNNHYEGSAPLTVRGLLEILQENLYLSSGGGTALERLNSSSRRLQEKAGVGPG